TTTGHYTHSLHDALPIWSALPEDWSEEASASLPHPLPGEGPSRAVWEDAARRACRDPGVARRSVKQRSEIWSQRSESEKRTVTRSEEHTSELQSRFDLVC